MYIKNAVHLFLKPEEKYSEPHVYLKKIKFYLSRSSWIKCKSDIIIISYIST